MVGRVSLHFFVFTARKFFLLLGAGGSVIKVDIVLPLTMLNHVSKQVVTVSELFKVRTVSELFRIQTVTELFKVRTVTELFRVQTVTELFRVLLKVE